jgi:hypothetical protein
MQERPKLEYIDLDQGYEFPPSVYKIDSSYVSAYLNAVEDTEKLYEEKEVVPPGAVAAYAMASLSNSISMPTGSIHVSQELEFLETVGVNETITCRARVNQKHKRGALNLMMIDLEVLNDDSKKVITGKTSFILPTA